MERCALLIGIKNSVATTENDLLLMHDFLLTVAGGAWKENEVLVCLETDRASLFRAFQVVEKCDFLLVYVSANEDFVNGEKLGINENGKEMAFRQLEGIARKQVNVYDLNSEGDEIASVVSQESRTCNDKVIDEVVERQTKRPVENVEIWGVREEFSARVKKAERRQVIVRDYGEKYWTRRIIEVMNGMDAEGEPFLWERAGKLLENSKVVEQVGSE